ncbi:nck-associated protein 5-like [Scleropages formosus]|uniref:Nck-associated protein 5-like n=1 Tax=Scleropages formosus TaxID=113540 RepID=A0A8C9RZU1_SCLFO|nr:nck-associated protein 5-like [Scleropages formosus]XP_029103825.1 nck-associated protein 5-like [Scleropages formosus]
MEMSEETELRECDEAFESEEGDIEPYLDEPESSRELLERLRELEAENSALALANESQREAYERCLDEVANHVVQALLNQKDLREECIKLKMRVFDLERQNRTLTELFHQKLHSQSSTAQQLLQASHTEHHTETQLQGPDRLTEAHSEAQAKNNEDSLSNGTADTRAPPTSMEALSPFFKKKAHILEVLRRLEETDPLKFHPCPGLTSCHEFNQALIPAEAVLVPSGISMQPKAHQPTCRHSCSDSDIHEYPNGEGTLPEDHSLERESCQSCLMLSQKSLASVLKCNQGQIASHNSRSEELGGLRWSEVHGASAHNTDFQTTVPLADDGDRICVLSTSAEQNSLFPGNRDKKSEEPPQLGSRDGYLYSGLKDAGLNDASNGEPKDTPVLGESKTSDLHESCSNKLSTFAFVLQCKTPRSEAIDLPLTESVKHINTGDVQDLSTGQVDGMDECYFEVAAEAANVKNDLYTITSDTPVPEVTDSSQSEYCEQEGRESKKLYYSSNEASVFKKVAVDSYLPVPALEKNGTTQQSPVEKTKLVLSPTSFNEIKSSPVSSPSRLLKFLKIPTIGERAQATNPLRLSPQLTRSSKIPCRNNNYEVHHSPVTGRKATTTERDRQPQSSRTDSYPVTHSAPTSPPKPEDSCSPTAREINFSSHSAPKASHSSKMVQSSQSQRGCQKMPHYENVSDVSTSYHVDSSPQFFEGQNASHFLPYSQSESCNEDQPKLLEEKMLSHSFQQPSVSPTVDQHCDFSPSDTDTDTESADWYKIHDHHGLPTSSVPHKVQGSELLPPQSGAQRGEPPSKKSITGKPPSESSHHLFKERLAALGKLKSTEDLNVNAPPMDKKDLQCNVGKAVSSSTGEKSKTAERQSDHNAAENKQSKYTDSLDGKPYHKHNPSNHPIKFPGPIQQYESGNKPVNTSSPATKTEVETFSSKIYVAKAEGPKIKVNMPSSCSEPPQVLRNYMKCSTTQNPPYSSKTAPSPQSSPTKVPSKSPSKPGQVSSNPRAAKPFQDDRISQKPSPRAEDKNRLTANKKKSSAYAENLPPAPPRPSEVLDDRRPFASGPQSAIEQKVMKGIEENMLKLQEQDRGHMAEVKQKASNGIASWFGLKKSKLPALNRKPEMSKLKLSMPSASKEAKAAAKKKLEVESLNISKLMEKAEDLRRALEEERAYVNGVALDRPGRGHSCEVVMDQAQGQLSVMYRGMSSDNFMQQLLNRVDERDSTSFSLAPRRLSFDSKKSRPLFGHQKNGISNTKSKEEMEKGSDLVSKDVPSDDSLAESISSQHFTGSGSSMRTLDSGIGTFPLPDYAGGAVVKSVPKFKSQGEQEFLSSQGKLGPVTKAPRKAHTLERELSALEEVNTCALYGSALEEKDLSIQLSNTIHEDVDDYEADMQSPPSKNWTFPNLKPTTGPTDMYLGVKEETETAPHGTPFRRSARACGPPAPHEADPASLPLPPQVGLGRRGKSQTPITPERNKDGGVELIKERPEDILSPSRPPALETPESLSDSLYDSLSSCGSQG